MQTFELFDPSPSGDTSIACDPSALDDPTHHKEQFEVLFEDCEEVREVSGGLAFRFPGGFRYAEQVLDYISRERQCCPFLAFEIAIEPEERGVWLYMGGDERVEEYLIGAFGQVET